MQVIDSSLALPDETISADFDRLYELAGSLRALAQVVGDRDSIVPAGAGDPDLTDRLRHAERDWSSHRRALGSFLAGAAEAVEQCLAAYREHEGGLVRAARPVR